MKISAQDQEQIHRFVQWGQSNDALRAMILTSSRASPSGPIDVFSDYDLILILTDIHPFFEDRGWLADFGPVLVVYRDPILVDDGLERSAYVIQYENGLKIDFSLWPVERLRRIVAAPALPDEFDAGYRILLDKDQLTDGLKSPTYKGYIPTAPSQTAYNDLVEWHFQDACYVAKFLWRDDLVAAKHILELMRQEYLLPMLEWRSEIDHGWSVKPGPYGRRLKQWLRADLWAELENTYTGADLDANWEALFRMLALFRKVAVEVGDQLGYAYPHDLDRRTMAYLRKVHDLDRLADTFA